MTDIHLGSIVSGPLLPEPVEVLALVPVKESVTAAGQAIGAAVARVGLAA